MLVATAIASARKPEARSGQCLPRNDAKGVHIEVSTGNARDVHRVDPGVGGSKGSRGGDYQAYGDVSIYYGLFIVPCRLRHSH